MDFLFEAGKGMLNFIALFTGSFAVACFIVYFLAKWAVGKDNKSTKTMLISATTLSALCIFFSVCLFVLVMFY